MVFNQALSGFTLPVQVCTGTALAVSKYCIVMYTCSEAYFIP